MAGQSRESAEDKIRRFIREELGAHQSQQEEARDPNMARLRKMLREESEGAVERALAKILGDDDQDQDQGRGGGGEGENILQTLFGKTGEARR